jgi:hypothetical protein
MPFNLTPEDETEIVSYITEMQCNRRETTQVSHCKDK